jgi:DNA-binding SARP family transcriptional activator
MMNFRLLGSLEVSIEGATVELGGNRQRTAMAVLLLYAGRVVPLARLVDALWDDSPATAKGQVQTCISALRRQLADQGADGLISTSPAGYTLSVPPGSLDIANFEDMIAAARAIPDDRPDDVVREFRAALALWRGPAAADVPSRLVQAVAIRLNEDRLSVLEECIEAELALGRHHHLVGELNELAKEYPFRESLRAQQMLALYRSSRQAEALESFQEVRCALMEELGLEPTERLCALQRAILAKDAALDLHSGTDGGLPAGRPVTAVVPRQLPAAVADFTGRQEMLGNLVALLSPGNEPDEQQYLPVVTLTGRGGVGKTALALNTAHAVRHLYSDGQLFVQLQDADDQPISPMELLAGLLRSLGLPSVALPDLLAERTAAYRSWLGNRKVLIVLDDAHSLSQIEALIPGSPSCGVIITSRVPLSSLPGAWHFDVDDLDEDTSVELLAKMIGPERMRAEPTGALTLVRLCDCLPLAMRIVAAKLATRRHWSLHQMILRMTDEAKRLDELVLRGMGIRTTLATSYSGLSVPLRRLFRLLSLMGTADFASWASAPLLDLDVEAATDLLEVLVEARLVEARVGEDGSCRFRLHDLVRIYAQERLAADEPLADRAAALQRLLACWLSLAVEAHRRAYGGDYGVLHGHAGKWELPAHVRDQLLGNPLSWFRIERAGLVLAITRAAQIGLDELCWDLAVTAVTLFESEHRIEDWQKTHELALEATRRAGNVRGEAAVQFSLGNLAHHGQLSEAPRHLESALRAFDQLGDVHGRALALGALAFSDRLNGDSHRALARYQLALTGFRQVRDRGGEVDVLSNMAQMEMDRGHHDEAQHLLDQAFALSRSLRAPRIAAQIENRLGELYLCTNDTWRAERAFRSVLRIVRDEGDLVGEAYALAGLGTVSTRMGRYELAQADLSAAVSLSQHMPSKLVHGRILLASAELYLAKEAPEAATPLISEALKVFSEIGPAPVWRARFLELKARIEEAAGNPQAAAADRDQALDLVGDADPGLSLILDTALRAAAGAGLLPPSPR